MRLECKACGAPIELGDIDMSTGLASCQACGSVYDLSGRDHPDIDERASRPRFRPKAPMPPRFKVQQASGTMEISWRWARLAALFLIPFCIAWDSFLVFWYVTGAIEGAPWIMFVFPIAHVSVGIGLTWYCLATLLNTTTLTVGRGWLRIRHGPLYWPGRVDVPTSSLDQLYARKRVSHSKNGTTVRFELHAVLKDGKNKKLLKGLDEIEQALWLEQELEAVLGIRDRAVAGELEK
jgi:hypothetical protein